MDVRNKFDKILYLYSMLMVWLQVLPSTQTPNMLWEFFARENFLLYLFIFFPTLAWMWNRVHANNWKNTRGDGGHGSITDSVSCYFSLIFSSVFAWPHSSQPVFRLSHGAVSLPTGLPPPAAIAKRGLKTRGEQKHPGWHTHRTPKENRKTQINLQKNSKFNPLFTASCWNTWF